MIKVDVFVTALFIIAIICVIVAFLFAIMVIRHNKRELLDSIKKAKENKSQFKLENGIWLDFREDWVPVLPSRYSGRSDYKAKKGKYYLLTKRFPTGNRTMELIKCNDNNLSWGNTLRFPEFTVAVMELDIEPYKN
jgi:hypothetical protein